MTTLGTGLINVANPEIQTYFAISLSDAAWVVTSYLIAVSVMLLVFGRLGDVIGYRRLFSLGVWGFAASSLLCSVSGHFALLLICRVLQGVAAAMLMSMGPALITTSFPPQQQDARWGPRNRDVPWLERWTSHRGRVAWDLRLAVSLLGTRPRICGLPVLLAVTPHPSDRERHPFQH